MIVDQRFDSMEGSSGDDWTYPYPMEREKGIEAYQAMITAEQYQRRSSKGELDDLAHKYSVDGESPVLELEIITAQEQSEGSLNTRWPELTVGYYLNGKQVRIWISWWHPSTCASTLCPATPPIAIVTRLAYYGKIKAAEARLCYTGYSAQGEKCLSPNPSTIFRFMKPRQNRTSWVVALASRQ